MSARLATALADRYRIEREIGAGGMATVYLAHDLRHDRPVAIKVLRTELAAVVGGERFLAEIRTTANLRHLHILPLFDSGQADGFLYYVMPYVEGESLRERLERERQLPVEEAVRIAKDLAEALDHAHRKGVIHRDIKPANVLLLDGKPVVSDFGIALAVGKAGDGRITETGLSLGTPHYMSPEQATGEQHIGPATDTYALACVLYEMLVGEPPYTGATPQAVLGKILTAAPQPVTEGRKSVPANVDAAIRRALEKLPADRFATAADFGRALADPTFTHGDALIGVGTPTRRPVGLLWGAGWVAAAGLAATLFVRSAVGGPSAAPTVTFRLALPEGQRFVRGVGPVNVAWTPDGSSVVYVGPSERGGQQLWKRPLGQLDAVPIPGTEGGEAPTVSPDGQSVAFWVQPSALRIVPLAGGPVTTVVEGGVGGWMDWESDGMLYFGLDGIVHRVSVTGGQPQKLTTPDPGTAHLLADVLPNDAGILFTVRGTGAPPELNVIAWAPRDGGRHETLFAGTMARYVSSGHVVYTVADGTLMAAPFDLGTHSVTGTPSAVLRGVDVHNSSAGQFAVAPTGSLVYVPGNEAASAGTLVQVTRGGATEEVDSAWQGRFGSLALAPDGARLAASIGSPGPRANEGLGPQQIWIKDLEQGTLTKLTLEGTGNFRPSWGADRRSILYLSNQKTSSFDLWRVRADGTGTPTLVLDLEESIMGAVESPDGKAIVFRLDVAVNPRTTNSDLMVARPSEDTVPRPLIATRFREYSPAISPDGHWLAYVSNESDRSEVYVRPFPNVDDGRWPISNNGGNEPVWSHSGKELFYRSADDQMVAVTVSGTNTLAVGERRILFSAEGYRREGNHPSYVVTADDRGFIMVRMKPVPEVTQDPVVIQGFVDDLRAGGAR